MADHQPSFPTVMDPPGKRRRLEADGVEGLNASIRAWAVREGILFGKPPTHSAFPIGRQAGFSFRIETKAQNKKLRDIIARDPGRPFAITERAQGVFAFFLDVDLHSGETTDWDTSTEEAVRSVLEALSRSFPGSRSIVTASTTVTLRDKRRVAIAEASGSAGKRGVHIVFPRLLVDKERAMTIRRDRKSVV